MSNAISTDAELEGVTEKTMAERAKEVGRDGAYLEIDAKDLLKAYRSGELQKAKIVVIKAARIEISDYADIQKTVQNVHNVAAELAYDKPMDCVSGMSDEQASMWIFMKAFSKGLGL